MPEAKFLLKEPSSKEPTLIYLLYRFNNQTLKYSTSQKINPKFWNSEKQRAKETRSFPEYSELNNLLNDLGSNVNTAHRKLINLNTTPTPAKLKDQLNKALFKEEYAQKKGLLKFIEELITTTNRKRNTLNQWKQTLRKLVEYKKVTKKEVDFDTVNLDFYNSFVQFLTKENYTKNTIGNFIKNIKVFMNEAVDRKLTNNLEYRNKKFKIIEEQVDKIYLSEEEILKIYNLNLSENKRLEKVRDLFVVGCYTGLRFSDLIQVRAENVTNEGRYIRIRTEKTKEVVVIPLHKFVREVLKKYNGQLPNVISNQKMNDYLKEIGKLSDVNSVVKISATRGGTTENTIYKKHELITTHTARRSFSTNAYLMDIPSISIMKITSHKTEKSFLKYIKISQEENASKLLSHPFFKN